jgi:DNA primase
MGEESPMDSEVIREVRERNDIVEVISSYITLKRVGKNYVALCPFHQEKTPSFTVSPDKQLWHCFGCKLGGDVIGFVQRIENISFGEALRKLAERVGIRIHGERSKEEALRSRLIEINQLAMHFYERMLWSSAGEVARSYLKARGVSWEIARKFHLGYAPAEWEALSHYLREHSVSPEEAVSAGLLVKTETGDKYYDRFRDRLMFPIMSRSGEVIGFGGRALSDNTAKYINTPETPIFQKRNVLYALHIASTAIRESGSAIVVEGYMDAIALHQFGFANTVATMGTALTPQMLSQLRRYAQTIYLAFDADSAGMNAMLRSSLLFRQEGIKVKVVALPKGIDPDECVRKHGVDAFRSLLERSLEMLDYKVECFLSSPDGGKPSSNALRQLTALLMELDDPLERERVMQRVARHWAEGDGGRVIQFVEAIRSALKRAEAMRQTARGETYGTGDIVEQTIIDHTKSHLPKGVEQAERELIAAMLQDESVARMVLKQLPPQEFITELGRQIASIVTVCIENNEFHNISHYISELQDERLRSEACGLMMVELNFLNSEEAIEGRVRTIQRFKCKQQLKVLRETILQKVASGDINISSQEVEKLLKLEKEFRSTA